jgi:hypothetical protein
LLVFLAIPKKHDAINGANDLTEQAKAKTEAIKNSAENKAQELKQETDAAVNGNTQPATQQ